MVAQHYQAGNDAPPDDIPHNVSRLVPRSSPRWDRNDVIHRLTPADVQAIYRSLGVERFAPGGHNDWKCFVPWRDNTNTPAMTIRMKDGVWSDKATGEGGSIFDAVERAGRADGLDAAIGWVAHHRGWVKSEPRPAEGKREVGKREFVYTSAAGEPLYKAVRTDYLTESGKKSKDFRQFTYDHGHWHPRGPSDAIKVLYGLPLLADPSRADDSIIIVEGEVCAEAARDAFDVLATCIVGGSNAWRDCYAPYFTGRDVVILPDNDNPGWKFAETAAQALSSHAATVRVVVLPDLGERKGENGLDIVDWIERGHSRDELQALIEAAPEWTPIGDIQAEAERPRYEFLTARQLKAIPPPEWLIADVIPEGSAGGLGGESEAFKSFAALEMSNCIATGQSWHGKAVKQGPTLYISGEGWSGLGKRLQAWETARRVELPDEALFLPEAVHFLDSGDVDGLINAIKGLPFLPVFVVVDTLARALTGGNENDSADMGVLISTVDRIRRETGAAVLVIHHFGKSGTWRGHTSFYAALDVAIVAERESKESLTVVLKCDKAKDADHFKPLRLIGRTVDLGTRDEYGRDLASLVFDMDDDQSERLQHSEQTVYDVLHMLDADGKGCTAGQWEAACVQHGVSRATFYRHKGTLINKRRVIERKEGGSKLFSIVSLEVF